MTDKPDSSPARVFISCGQTRGSDEYATADAVARRLEELGFDAYVALQEQSLNGLRENIFERLEKSEYFIFVDFKREQLIGPDPPVCRGSLFSHQELALASYLRIPVLAFQEKGVKQDDGILRFLQANATQFTDRHLLPSVIADEVRRLGWDPNWRNELLLERSDPTQHGDARMMAMGAQKTGRFFHIGVRNRHQRMMARSCYIYLEKVTRLEGSVEIPLRAVELKWEGYLLPSAHIPPGTVRPFDAFYIFHDDATRLQFQMFSDSTEFIPHVQGEGRYELRYAVVADNFPTARGTFLLDLRSSLPSTTLTQISGPDHATHINLNE
jgi:hypothetical protein